MELRIVDHLHCEACDKLIKTPGLFYLIAIWDNEQNTFIFLKSNKYGFKAKKGILGLKKIVPTQRFVCSQECAMKSSQDGDYVLCFNTHLYRKDVFGYKILKCYRREKDLLKKTSRFWEKRKSI